MSFILGYYMLAQQVPSPQTLGTQARLISPKVLVSTKNCLEFRYHMSGAGTGVLHVYRHLSLLERYLLFEVVWDQGPTWKKGYIEVLSPESHLQIEFEASMGYTSNGIAIDDVVLRKGSCNFTGEILIFYVNLLISYILLACKYCI